MNKFVAPLLAAAVASLSSIPLAQHVNAATPPLRPPSGRYVYAMSDDTGKTVFKSTITISGNGSIFNVSETTKLPNGAIATTRSTWSTATLLPRSFELHQGKVTLRAQITPAALKLNYHGKQR